MNWNVFIVGYLFGISTMAIIFGVFFFYKAFTLNRREPQLHTPEDK
jgi:hypothetical protein